MQHVTQAKRALKTLLRDRLPLKLQQGDLEANDGVTTPVPFEIHTTEKDDLGGYPAIELIVQGSRPEHDSTAQVMRHRIAVGFTLIGDAEEALTVQVERYMWAIRRVARDTWLHPDVDTGSIDTGDENYTPLNTKPEGLEVPFAKGGWIELVLTTVE